MGCARFDSIGTRVSTSHPAGANGRPRARLRVAKRAGSPRRSIAGAPRESSVIGAIRRRRKSTLQPDFAFQDEHAAPWIIGYNRGTSSSVVYDCDPNDICEERLMSDGWHFIMIPTKTTMAP